MRVGQNIIVPVFICTVFIISQRTLFSDGFVIPPYHYYGFMGGNYFPCNWGYSYCTYLPQDYYYDNGCTGGCDYDVQVCLPCGPESQSLPVSPSVPTPSVTTEENGSPGLSEVTPARSEEEEEMEEEEEEDVDDYEEDYDEDA